jgi:hypothetical protein
MVIVVADHPVTDIMIRVIFALSVKLAVTGGLQVSILIGGKSAQFRFVWYKSKQ